MIRTLLVANRGEIAARVIRSAHDADIACVAVFSDADADAEYVAEADESVHLPGAELSATYLDGAALIEAARRTGADAVHPGYGFLSENAGFARACADAGLTFVGPSVAAIESMGSKLAAKEIMAAAGVPVLPSVTVDGDFAPEHVAGVGFPALVKAAFGGGGRGMRIVRDAGELAGAVAAAQREAAAAFGDGTVFVERYVERPRHIEVQIFGDTEGTVLHLFERECSIQRRYQKIIEEAPSPAVTETRRAELGEAAVAAGKAIGYLGAGTVEFVLGEDGFYFLEMNTRLQVEHPVTEAITGLDLVRLQLAVAEGKPLPPEARAATMRGHAIEARVYAEDVPAGFLPMTGTVRAFDVPARAGLRVDAGVRAGTRIGPQYDAMLAKVIAHGADRDDARRLLARSLAETRLHGVVTNRDLLVGILREDEFAAGGTDTGYLTRHDPASLAASAHAPLAATLHPLAAALAGQAERRDGARALGTLPSGWRNVPGDPQHAEFTVDGEPLTVSYRVDGAAVRAKVGEQEVSAHARTVTPGRVELDHDGVRRNFTVARYGDEFWVDSALGSSALTEQPRFADPSASLAAGSLTAPMPGTVLRVVAATGDEVAAGATVLVLEAMKMEHAVTAPAAGTVTEITVHVGEAVELGAVLAVVDAAEGEQQ